MYITMITVFVLVALVWAALYSDTLPKKYRDRKCMGKHWKNSFPNSSNEEIRKFLLFFTYAFAFSSKDKLKFEPEDKLFEIYRELYPSKWDPDQLEFETLATDLDKKYGLKFEDIWHDELSLGELFKLMQKSKLANA